MDAGRIAPWIPFLFSLVLCGIVMVTSLAVRSYEAAFPAFFCFLPMVFYFGAAAHFRARLEIQALRDRIERLEAARA